MTIDENSGSSRQDSGAGVAEVVAPARPQAANPAALTIEQLARALGVPTATIERHMEDGAPAGADDRINLIQYCAWLNKRLAEREAGDGD